MTDNPPLDRAAIELEQAKVQVAALRAVIHKALLALHFSADEAGKILAAMVATDQEGRMTADEIEKFCLDTFTHEYFEVGNDEQGAMLVVVAAVLGRLSQWAREEAMKWDGRTSSRQSYNYMADQLDALRSALTGERKD